jgi:DNA helicase-2/ATP-dependent DNA helicase PcrA
VAAADEALPAGFFADIDAELEALIAEARAARVSRVDVPLPSALSASQVLALRADPDGLARSLARPMPSKPARAARRGTAFHAWVEQRFGVTPLIDPDDLAGSADEPVTDEELSALQEAFLATPFADREPAAVEAPFATMLGGRLVRGRIDAVYDEGDGRWLVVDWKTGRESADPLQLAIYRTAWARQAGVADDAVAAAFLTVRTGKLEMPGLLSTAELNALLR